MTAPTTNSQAVGPQTLDLRDIHLPDPVSWWPVSAGWWLAFTGVLLLFITFFVIRKIYKSRQLKREINSEIELIKKQFSQDQNKSQLAKSLSILLRRASISFYPAQSTAGLTGENWLMLLDQSNAKPLKNLQFKSDIGKVLILAPYQSEDSLADYDSDTLIHLCESWLSSSHNRPLS